MRNQTISKTRFVQFELNLLVYHSGVYLPVWRMSILFHRFGSSGLVKGNKIMIRTLDLCYNHKYGHEKFGTDLGAKIWLAGFFVP